MELRHILKLARRWLGLILLGALLGAGAGYGVSLLSAPVYQAQATILLNGSANPAGQRYEDLLAADRLGKTYADLLTRRVVLQQAIKELDPSLSEAALTQQAEDLAKRAEAEQIRETQLLEVRVRDNSAGHAADLANRLATVFIAQLTDTNAGAFKQRRERLEAEMAANETAYQQANITLLQLQAGPSSTRTPEQQAEISRLMGLVAEYHTTRGDLLRTLDQVALAEASAADSLILIERAISPDRPILPIIPLNVGLGLLAGLGLATALAWVLQQLRDSAPQAAVAGVERGRSRTDAPPAPTADALPRAPRSVIAPAIDE